ncbi:energy transducer TonB family protein [Acidicapsa ligni]|uniref:energy transducer TonB family protein n=1 Tax=Acidicapsa ligni TaxID=542300 RepID=UPI0021DF6FBE|nr:energy transducer TonB [Acidicapsa ligni]
MPMSFGRTALSFAFLLLFASPVQIVSAQAPVQRELNTLEIIGDDVPQPDRSILKRSVTPQMAQQTRATWLPLVPPEAQPPQLAAGIVAIQFNLHADGSISEMKIDRSTGIVALDPAAWHAIVATRFAALPPEMALKTVRMQMVFVYNEVVPVRGPEPALR